MEGRDSAQVYYHISYIIHVLYIIYYVLIFQTNLWRIETVPKYIIIYHILHICGIYVYLYFQLTLGGSRLCPSPIQVEVSAWPVSVYVWT